MQNAFDRCYRAVPVTLENLRPTRGTVAIKCFTTSCPNCRSFDLDLDGRRSFEQTLSATYVLPWNCDDPELGSMAVAVGVTDLPAYIVLSSDEVQPRVVRP